MSLSQLVEVRMLEKTGQHKNANCSYNSTSCDWRSCNSSSCLSVLRNKTAWIQFFLIRAIALFVSTSFIRQVVIQNVSTYCHSSNCTLTSWTNPNSYCFVRNLRLLNLPFTETTLLMLINLQRTTYEVTIITLRYIEVVY